MIAEKVGHPPGTDRDCIIGVAGCYAPIGSADHAGITASTLITFILDLSFPKITSGRIDDAARPKPEWLLWRQTVGLLDATAHLSAMPVRARLIVIRRIRNKNSPQVRLAEDDHLV